MQRSVYPIIKVEWQDLGNRTICVFEREDKAKAYAKNLNECRTNSDKMPNGEWLTGYKVGEAITLYDEGVS